MIARLVTFTSMPMWVQVWGLPFDLIFEETGWDIKADLGQVVEINKKAFTLE